MEASSPCPLMAVVWRGVAEKKAGKEKMREPSDLIRRCGGSVVRGGEGAVRWGSDGGEREREAAGVEMGRAWAKQEWAGIRPI